MPPFLYEYHGAIVDVFRRWQPLVGKTITEFYVSPISRPNAVGRTVSSWQVKVYRTEEKQPCPS